jgi:hypothetical protein
LALLIEFEWSLYGNTEELVLNGVEGMLLEGRNMQHLIDFGGFENLSFDSRM